MIAKFLHLFMDDSHFGYEQKFHKTAFIGIYCNCTMGVGISTWGNFKISNN
jgi:hypothetical protein